MFSQVIIFSLVAAAATILGTLSVFCWEKWSRKNSIFLVSFAAGFMLAAAFLHLIPESLELSSRAMFAVLAGVVVFYLIQQNIILIHPCHDQNCEIHRLGIISFTGLAFHSLLDGVIIVVGFEAGFHIGVLTTMAVLAHELPEGITTTGLLLHSGESRARVWLFSVIVALATPLGAVLSYLFLRNASSHVLGMLLGLAAGSFIYIAGTDLVPETHRQHNRFNALIFLAGVATLICINHYMH